MWDEEGEIKDVDFLRYCVEKRVEVVRGRKGK